MNYYRISKYDPAYRDKNGVYTKDEWTEFCDIGERFEGKVFTYDEYLIAENNYIQAVKTVMDINRTAFFTVTGLEYNTCPPTDAVSEGMTVTRSDMDRILPLLFRNVVWCRLVSDDLNIYMGFDYYLHCESREVLDGVKLRGVFTEPWCDTYE